MRNVTLSIDDALLESGRAYAQTHNLSFNAMVRELVRRAVAQDSPWIDECFLKMDKAGGKAAGKTWRREELYDA